MTKYVREKYILRGVIVSNVCHSFIRLVNLKQFIIYLKNAGGLIGS
jgi:hypothetical protein